MSTESAPASGKRFARDMRRIREDREVSVEAIHEATRIAHTLIDSFEEGKLYDHPAFNRVYLRSFVRAYADTVGIDADVALDALDDAMNDEYTNELVARYLDTEPLSDNAETFAEEAIESLNDPESQPSTPKRFPEEDGPEDEADVSDSASSEDVEVSKDEDDGEKADTSYEEASSSSDRFPRSESSDTSDTSTDDSDAFQESEKPQADDADAVPSWLSEDASGEDMVEDTGTDRASSEPSPGDPASSGEMTSLGTIDDTMPFPDRASSPSQTSRSGPPTLAILGGGAAVVLLLAVIGYFAFTGDDAAPSPGPAPVADTTSQPDTAAVEEEAPSRPPLANVQIGAEIDLILLPGSDIRGIRIQRDDDLRRPYWIEEGAAVRFPFEERILISDPPDDIQVLIEGYRYPVRNLDAEGRLDIRRDSVEAFADTLRGAPVPLPDAVRTESIPPPQSQSLPSDTTE